MSAQELINLVQAIAIAHSVWRGDDHALAGLVAEAMGDGNRADEVRSLLHEKALASALASRQVALWFGHDKLARLIDQQSVSNRAALMRVCHHPAGNTCRYCLLADGIYELETEVGLDGEPIQGSFVHPCCAAAWRRLRLQCEASDE